MPEPDLISKLLPGDVILTSRLEFSPIKIGNFFKSGYHKRVWTHAALYLGNGEVVEAFPTGITKRQLQDAYLNDRTVGLKILRRKRLPPEVVQQIVTFCSQAAGGPYDRKALIYFVLANLLPSSLNFILKPGYLGRWFNVRESYFCSELISEGLKQADAYCFEHEPFQVMPADFDNALLFEEVATVPIPGKEKQSRAGGGPSILPPCRPGWRGITRR